jgi:hypothetical protein
VLEFLTDQNFLGAMATIIGPLAFFAAPTEEIEHLLMAETASDAVASLSNPEFIELSPSLPKAA